MLKEVRHVKQSPGEDLRRWFKDAYFDLYVWSDRAGRITGFQLCYDKPGTERALSWFSRKGFAHHRVDTGDELPTKNRAPVLVRDGLFPFHDIERHFAESSRSLDPKVAKVIAHKLKEFAGSLKKN